MQIMFPRRAVYYRRQALLRRPQFFQPPATNHDVVAAIDERFSERKSDTGGATRNKNRVPGCVQLGNSNDNYCGRLNNPP